MKKWLLILVNVLMLSVVAMAQLPDLKQYRTDQEKIKAINAFCTKMLQKERYDSLMMVSKAGFSLSKKIHNDTLNSIYSYYIGVGFESLPIIDSALYYFQLSERYGIHINVPKRVVNAQVKALEVMIGPSKIELANTYISKLEQEIKTYSKNETLVGVIAGQLAGIYLDRNQYEKSLTYHFLNLKMQRKLKDTTGIGTTLTNIGNVYIQMFNYSKAIQYLNEALPYLYDYRHGRMICFYNIGACYTDLKKYDEAIANYKRSVKIAKDVNDAAAANSIELKLGMAYTGKKQYQLAETSLTGTIKYAEKLNDATMLSDGYLGMADLNTAKKNYTVAIDWLQKSLDVAIKNKMTERETELYKSLAEATAAAKLFDKAYAYQAKYTLYKDSLVKESSKKTISQMEEQYQAEKKEHQIKLLDQKQKSQTLELQAQRRSKYFLLAGLASVLIIAGLMIRSYRIKQNANLALAGKNVELEGLNHELKTLNSRLDEANQSKTKLFSILSHDLRAPISSVFQFINLQKNYPKKMDEKESQKHNDVILQSAENLMESMEDILIWSKSQMESFSLNPGRINANELIDHTIAIHRDFAAERKITLEKDCQPDIILVTDVNFLKIVLRNVVSNGIKFTPAGGSIKISAEKQDDAVYFKIFDSGVGMSEEQIGSLFEWSSIRSDTSGLGLKLAKEFINRLGGSIRVDSKLNMGTTFIISVPVLEAATIKS